MSIRLWLSLGRAERRMEAPAYRNDGVDAQRSELVAPFRFPLVVPVTVVVMGAGREAQAQR
jgi:hypothetical protein